MKNQVVLVNEKDERLGLMEKLEAHEKAVLHRAFSVFLFNEKGETLLQKRAKTKYHSPELWTNAVCSHPFDNESYKAGALRRLQEELGIELNDLEESFHFIYKADVGQNLWEHELDHVFVGKYDGDFNLNPKEVSEIQWISLDKLFLSLKKNPEIYTEWFKIILTEYKNNLL